MPFTAEQLIRGADYTLDTYMQNDPVDQITTDRPFLKWLIENKQERSYGNGSDHEAIRVANDSNYQNYFGADQVTYNERDPARQTEWNYFNWHDGFHFDEDRLKANGIAITDAGDASPDAIEKERLLNVLDESYTALKEGAHDAFGLEVLQDGSQSTKAVPGLDHLVSLTPATGIVNGINSATATYWQNNVSLSIAAANLIEELEQMWRACTRYGGQKPDKLFCGEAFLDDYRVQAGQTINRQIDGMGNAKGGVSLDASVSGLFFKGIPLVWDPTFEALDAELGAITHPWTKRCYMLNSKTIKLHPVKGDWMRKRKTQRLPDRYVYYFGLTSKQGMKINKRNANAVLTLD